MCHIMFRFHVYDLTFVSESGGDGGGVTGEMAAEPVTTVQDCVSTFVGVSLINIFRETS